MTEPQFPPSAADRPARAFRPGLNAIRALIVQAAIVVVVFVPGINPEFLDSVGVYGLWALVFVPLAIGFLPLSILALTLGLFGVMMKDRREVVLGRVAIVGSIVVFVAAVLAVVAAFDAQTM